MNININSNLQPILFLKEKFSFLLTPMHKKIAIVVALALSGLGILYAINKYYFKAKPLQNNEESKKVKNEQGQIQEASSPIKSTEKIAKDILGQETTKEQETQKKDGSYKNDGQYQNQEDSNLSFDESAKDIDKKETPKEQEFQINDEQNQIPNDSKPSTEEVVKEIQKQETPKEQEIKIDKNNFQECIKSLNDHQVELIAKNLISSVMKHLQIDVSYFDMKKKGANGENLSDHGFYYDPQSKFMSLHLPIVVEKLKTVFANPDQFKKDKGFGVNLKFLGDDGITGKLNDQDINDKIDKIKAKFLKEIPLMVDLPASVILTVDEASSINYSKLYFRLDYLCGTVLGNHGHDLDTLQEYADSNFIGY